MGRENPSEFDRKALLNEVLRMYELPQHGIHGVGHWARVRYHGMKVGQQVGADLLVVELFAWLHDSCRRNESQDRLHGPRAAEFARRLNGTYFQLDDLQLEKLCVAISDHTNGEVHGDVTIQTCWDADRLDLGRVGIEPRKDYLSAFAATMIPDAIRRSRGQSWSVKPEGLVVEQLTLIEGSGRSDVEEKTLTERFWLRGPHS